MTTTSTLPVIPGGFLEALHRDWDARGWDRTPLAYFRMELPPEGDGGEGGDQGSGGDAGAGGDSGSGGPDSSKSFTQADVDRIVGERLARAKATPPADYDDLKAKAAKLDELEAANQTELERTQAERDAAAAARDAAIARANDVAMRTAVQLAAMAAGAADPDDVFALLPKDAVTVGDDGQVTGAAEAVKELLEKKPHLVGKPKTNGSADGGARGDAPAKPKTMADAVAAHYSK